MKLPLHPFPTFLVLWIVSAAWTTQATSRTLSSATTTTRHAFFPRIHKRQQERYETEQQDSIHPLVLALRGGSTKASSSTNVADAEALRAYRWQQQLYLQSRSMQLRQALLARGLDGLHHSPEALEEAKKHVPVDWDCALATRQHPKSCLYSFDAEPGTKVVAPRDTTQWISLSALNRLRRNDPTKVEPLWHSQYSILATWLNPESQYSM